MFPIGGSDEPSWTLPSQKLWAAAPLPARPSPLAEDHVHDALLEPNGPSRMLAKKSLGGTAHWNEHFTSFQNMRIRCGRRQLRDRRRPPVSWSGTGACSRRWRWPGRAWKRCRCTCRCRSCRAVPSWRWYLSFVDLIPSRVELVPFSNLIVRLGTGLLIDALIGIVQGF